MKFRNACAALLVGASASSFAVELHDAASAPTGTDTSDTYALMLAVVAVVGFIVLRRRR